MKAQGGYTVLETLIVLSCSMVILLGAMFFISGKQRVTEFTQSIRSIQGDVQQILNEVGSGYYPNISGINCLIDGSGNIQINSNPGVDTQGTNQPCVFLGRALQFNVDDPSVDEIYNVFTVVGKNNQTTMAGAKARLIARGSGDPGSFPNEFEPRKLKYGLTISGMYYNDDPINKKIMALAFVSNLNTTGVGDGSQQVNVLAIPESSPQPPLSTVAGIDQINAGLAGAIVNPENGVQICFNSGGTDQSAVLMIGYNGRVNSVETKIYSGPGCS